MDRGQKESRSRLIMKVSWACTHTIEYCSVCSRIWSRRNEASAEPWENVEAWGGGGCAKVYGDGGCLQGDDSLRAQPPCTVTTLIMIFNPADASVASIVPANEGTKGWGWVTSPFQRGFFLENIPFADTSVFLTHSPFFFYARFGMEFKISPRNLEIKAT